MDEDSVFDSRQGQEIFLSSRYSDGLRAGRPKNRGSIRGRGKRFFSSVDIVMVLGLGG
jgi:hypothetical protein